MDWALSSFFFSLSFMALIRRAFSGLIKFGFADGGPIIGRVDFKDAVELLAGSLLSPATCWLSRLPERWVEAAGELVSLKGFGSSF
jgi:hypothetical protein